MNLIAARVGLKRIQDFLSAESMQSNAAGALPSAPSAAMPPNSSSGSGLRHASGTSSTHGVADTNMLTEGSSGVTDGKDSFKSPVQHVLTAAAAGKGVDGTAGRPTAISISNGTFVWGDEAPVLKDVTLRIPSGALVMVVGPVGSGKSSLLSALLGEMKAAPGSGAGVEVRGQVAYTAQVGGYSMWHGQAPVT
jgi:ABC-type multidrug transport system fused ATPase/permease subunit